ncbi:long-chain-fatty-acid--CoA ligase [Amycolatopsis sp. NBC_01480]|uniref:long-chain-fatty-acid--CoA ligase n=1 Tax=Amycolatopsis sp. NBC_01480 TaxID=2903562 RepID=UPI002E2A2176|nr:long-chain fatty acid--CoA ligase [Amycolatopsis sp. NBC_01480]
MVNLASFLDVTAAAHPDRVAVAHEDRSWTYAALLAEANKVAGHLTGLGLRRGESVALSCPNVPEFTAAYYGILKAGGVVVPLNVLLRPREIAYHLRDSGARFHIAYRAVEDLAGADVGRSNAVPDVYPIKVGPGGVVPWAERSPHFGTLDVHSDDVAVLIYTSGTSGQPKGAQLRHRNLRDNALASSAVYEIRTDPPDTFLCALPLFHAFGQTCLQNASVASGGKLVLLDRFHEVEVLRRMADDGVTVFAGVPTMYWRLINTLQSARDAGVRTDRIGSTLRVAASGGAALAAETHARFQRSFGVTILEGYGLSETSPAASSARLGEPVRVGSVGRALPGVELALLDEDWHPLPPPGDGDEFSGVGEIAVKGHNVMRGYHERPEATAAALRDGWLRTGDLARRDAEGFYYIVDRMKDLIIRGGFNVYPRELEEVLMTHEDVSLVAVVGVAHEVHGEEVKAVVVRRDGVTLTEAELLEWGKAQFAAYKYPRIIEFRDELPMTATGKILKRSLR